MRGSTATGNHADHGSCNAAGLRVKIEEAAENGMSLCRLTRRDRSGK
jgi:hypothetical protein